MSKHLIDFIGISKSYDSNLVLDDLNLYIRENEFLTLLGVRMRKNYNPASAGRL